MSAAKRGACAWPAALLGLFVAALILRLIGLRTGLPYVYNADENSHFVPRAVGMFGHGFNPDYFVNPPAFTYVLHFLYVLRYGRRPGVDRRGLRGRPDGRVHDRPRGARRRSARSPCR